MQPCNFITLKRDLICSFITASAIIVVTFEWLSSVSILRIETPCLHYNIHTLSLACSISGPGCKVSQICHMSVNNNYCLLLKNPRYYYSNCRLAHLVWALCSLVSCYSLCIFQPISSGLLASFGQSTSSPHTSDCLILNSITVRATLTSNEKQDHYISRWNLLHHKW